jgi:hypothetical protein
VTACPNWPSSAWNKSLFASFSSEKEESCLLWESCTIPKRPTANGRPVPFRTYMKKDSSFSEEKEAKRLLFLVLNCTGGAAVVRARDGCIVLAV